MCSQSFSVANWVPGMEGQKQARLSSSMIAFMKTRSPGSIYPTGWLSQDGNFSKSTVAVNKSGHSLVGIVVVPGNCKQKIKFL